MISPRISMISSRISLRISRIFSRISKISKISHKISHYFTTITPKMSPLHVSVILSLDFTSNKV